MVIKRNQERAETPFITCLLLTLSLLIPIVSVFLVSITTVDNNDKIHLHWDPMISRAKSMMNKTLKSNKPQSHFIVNGELGARNLCINGTREYENTLVFPHLVLEENQITLLNTDRRLRSRSSWQFCIAHHDHQHGFRLKTYPKSTTPDSKLNPKLDCDLYVSANSTDPTTDDWTWRSANVGVDSITVFSHLKELQELKLDTLFIAVKEKSNESQKSNSDRCILEIEIFPINNLKSGSEGSLRGVQ